MGIHPAAVLDHRRAGRHPDLRLPSSNVTADKASILSTRPLVDVLWGRTSENTAGSANSGMDPQHRMVGGMYVRSRSFRNLGQGNDSESFMPHTDMGNDWGLGTAIAPNRIRDIRFAADSGRAEAGQLVSGTRSPSDGSPSDERVHRHNSEGNERVVLNLTAPLLCHLLSFDHHIAVLARLTPLSLFVCQPL